MIWTCWLSLNCGGACNVACGVSLFNLYLNCIKTCSWISWISCLGSFYMQEKKIFVCFQKARAKRCLIKPRLLQPIMSHSVGLLTYLGPLLQVEHRPSTTPHQRTRTCAFRSASFQFYPNSFSSASVSRRRQLFLGRPLCIRWWFGIICWS